MKTCICRSLLILPVHVQKFVEKAYLRGADAIVLDLEDAVPPAEKLHARSLIKESIDMAKRGGAFVFVRINNEPELIKDDLEAAVLPGLHAIFLPKTESASQVQELARQIRQLEEKRNIESGSIKISLHIESPLGMLRLQEIAVAHERIESMSIGVDDYCLQLGVEPSFEGLELFLPFATMVNVCKAYGLEPMGILGTVAGFKDLEGFRRSAERGQKLGATGAFCIHPDQVPILNDIFSPSPHDAELAQKIVQAFASALEEGRAATSLEGKMIDTPIYKRALKTLELWNYFSGQEQKRKRTLGHD